MNYPVIPRTFFNGDCFDAYRILGAHPCTDPNGAEGWRFAVWAPGATAVEVCGGFDGWERGVPMEKADTGVWSAFIPGLAEGESVQIPRAWRGRQHRDAQRPLRLCHRAAPRHRQQADESWISPLTTPRGWSGGTNAATAR